MDIERNWVAIVLARASLSPRPFIDNWGLYHASIIARYNLQRRERNLILGRFEFPPIADGGAFTDVSAWPFVIDSGTDGAEATPRWYDVARGERAARRALRAWVEARTLTEDYGTVSGPGRVFVRARRANVEHAAAIVAPGCRVDAIWSEVVFYPTSDGTIHNGRAIVYGGRVCAYEGAVALYGGSVALYGVAACTVHSGGKVRARGHSRVVACAPCEIDASGCAAVVVLCSGCEVSLCDEATAIVYAPCTVRARGRSTVRVAPGAEGTRVHLHGRAACVRDPVARAAPNYVRLAMLSDAAMCSSVDR